MVIAHSSTLEDLSCQPTNLLSFLQFRNSLLSLAQTVSLEPSGFCELSAKAEWASSRADCPGEKAQERRFFPSWWYSGLWLQEPFWFLSWYLLLCRKAGPLCRKIFRSLVCTDHLHILPSPPLGLELGAVQVNKDPEEVTFSTGTWGPPWSLTSAPPQSLQGYRTWLLLCWAGFLLTGSPQFPYPFYKKLSSESSHCSDIPLPPR